MVPEIGQRSTRTPGDLTTSAKVGLCQAVPETATRRTCRNQEASDKRPVLLSCLCWVKSLAGRPVQMEEEAGAREEEEQPLGRVKCGCLVTQGICPPPILSKNQESVITPRECLGSE